MRERATLSSKRPFAVFDIDGTLIRWQLYHAVSDALVQLGYYDADLFEEVKAARILWKQRAGEESFKEYERSLVTAYKQILRQLTVDQFNEAAAVVFEEHKDQVYCYTKKLISDLKASGYLLFAISGSMEELVGKISEYYGFDDYVGSQHEHKNGRFTGNSVHYQGRKHEILDSLILKHGAKRQGSIAVGDSESDITMLSAVERPIAFNPTRGLFEEATRRGWNVTIERKNMIYNLEQQDGKYILAPTNRK